jgi:hypothetical protein
MQFLSLAAAILTCRRTSSREKCATSHPSLESGPFILHPNYLSALHLSNNGLQTSLSFIPNQRKWSSLQYEKAENNGEGVNYTERMRCCHYISLQQALEISNFSMELRLDVGDDGFTGMERTGPSRVRADRTSKRKESKKVGRPAGAWPSAGSHCM